MFETIGRGMSQTPRVRYLLENLKPRPGRIAQATAKSIWQGRGLRFSRKDRTFEVDKLFIIWLFALSLQACNRPVGITVMPFSQPIRARVRTAKNTSHIIIRVDQYSCSLCAFLFAQLGPKTTRQPVKYRSKSLRKISIAGVCIYLRVLFSVLI